LAAAINTFFVNAHGRLWLDPETSAGLLGPSDTLLNRRRQFLPDSLRRLYDEFVGANRLNVLLADSLRTSVTLQRWTQGRHIGDAEYVITVSRAGFSTDSTLALVHVMWGCGMLCGEGWLVALRRAGSGWEPFYWHQTLIS